MVPAPVLFLPHPRTLVGGVLLRRYKRFLSDVRLDSGQTVVAHCVNPGRMEGLVVRGSRVWLSPAEAGTQRKLAYTWEIAASQGVLVGANTAAPNRIVERLLVERRLRGFSRYDALERERRYGEGSRIDFWLRTGKSEHFLEVKNCHLVYPDGRAYFPDSVSARAARHLEELARVARQGHRASVLFTVQRADARAVRPSDVHDPAFAAAARRAAEAGVRFAAIRIRPTVEGYAVEGRIPVELAPYRLDGVRRWRQENEPSSGSC